MRTLVPCRWLAFVMMGVAVTLSGAGSLPAASGCYAIRPQARTILDERMGYISTGGTLSPEYRCDGWLTTVGDNQRFYLQELEAGSDRYFIYGTDEKFISSRDDLLGGLVAKAGGIPGTREQWQLVEVGNSVAFRSVADGRWLQANAGTLYGVIRTVESRGDWELFRLESQQGCSRPCVESFDPNCACGTAEGCWKIYAVSAERFLRRGSGAVPYWADSACPGRGEKFHLKRCDLDRPNRFLIYDNEGSYLASDAVGVVGAMEIPDAWAEWELVHQGGGVYGFRSVLHRRWLRAAPTVFAVSTVADLGDWEKFTIATTTGCSPPPEAGTDANVSVVTVSTNVAVWGIADLHCHAFAHLAFGGKLFWGAPYSRFGLEHALRPCASIPGGASFALPVPDLIHGPGGLADLIGNAVSTGDPASGHSVGGYPDFSGWPHWGNVNHQQMYYRWIERAYLGGLRLMVVHAVNNEAACSRNSTGHFYDCDDMEAVDRQIDAAYELERVIDWQTGGTGRGWFRIATNAAQARQIISGGKLAVVLGIEVGSLFGCHPHDDCSESFVSGRLEKYYARGVRHLFPVHHFENAFAGPALWHPVSTVGNRVANGEWFQHVVHCDESDFNLNELDLTSWLSAFLFTGELPPTYRAQPGHCSGLGLTALGQFLVRRMMDLGMIIDIDHMSFRAAADTLSMARTRGYPVVAGHTTPNDMGHHHEYTRTTEEMHQIRDLGGLFGLLPNQHEVVTYSDRIPNDCDKSSKSFAQSYLCAVDKMRGGPYLHAVGIGTDFSGFAAHPKPRFGPDGCDGETGRVIYPLAADARVATGTFNRQKTGNRTFDINTDGWAQVGLLPDFIQELKQIGLTDSELTPLFRSAEAYLEMWERIESGLTGVIFGNTVPAGQATMEAQGTYPNLAIGIRSQSTNNSLTLIPRLDGVNPSVLQVSDVTGGGTDGTVRVGVGSDGNRLFIGRRVNLLSRTGTVGYGASDDNAVEVEGTGAVWTIAEGLIVGRIGSRNTLRVLDGGTMDVGRSLIVGSSSVALDNEVEIDGGELSVSNRSGSVGLQVRRGRLVLDAGRLYAERLEVANGTNSNFLFNGGSLTTMSSSISTGDRFFVGDGTNSAVLNLLPGGPHSFADGLTVRSGARAVLSTANLEIPTGNLTTSGILELNGERLNFPSIRLNIVGAGGVVRNVSGSNTWAGQVGIQRDVRIDSDNDQLTLAGGLVSVGFLSASLTVGGKAHIQIGGSNVTRSLRLSKEGTGTLTLAGDHTFSGRAEVNEGRLQLTGTLRNPLTLRQAVLSGTGAIVGDVIVESGGRIEPGQPIREGDTAAAATGILSFSDLNTSDGAALMVKLRGTSPGATHDQVSVSNGLHLTGCTLKLELGYSPKPQDQFVIVTQAGNTPVDGVFQGLPEGGQLQADGYGFRISYAGGDGNDIVLTMVSPWIVGFEILDSARRRIYAQGVAAVEYAIEASSDLVHWRELMLAAPDDNGVIDFVDTGAIGQQQRFYRFHTAGE